jgi:hypothetical protein
MRPNAGTHVEAAHHGHIGVDESEYVRLSGCLAVTAAARDSSRISRRENLFICMAPASHAAAATREIALHPR